MTAMPHRSGRTVSLMVVILGLVLPVVLVLGGLHFFSLYRDGQSELVDVNRTAFLHMTGLNSPTANGLATRFSDLDGNLIADAPIEESQFIDPPTLNFSFVATSEPDRCRASWQPFLDHLSKVIGRPVNCLLFDNVNDQLKALNDGRLHVTVLKPGSVPTAVNVCGFVPVVTLPTSDGTGMASMEIIVRRDSGVNTLADLRGRELTLTEPGSSSGYKAPLVLLRSAAKLEPGRDYTIRYSGGQERSIQGIAARTYEAAAVNSGMVERALRHKRLNPSDYKTIYRSDPFPTAGLGYIYNLRPEVAVKVREALNTFDWKGTAMETETCFEGKPTRFFPANYKNQWALIRQIDDAAGTVHAAK